MLPSLNKTGNISSISGEPCSCLVCYLKKVLYLIKKMNCSIYILHFLIFCSPLHAWNNFGPSSAPPLPLKTFWLMLTEEKFWACLMDPIKSFAFTISHPIKYWLCTLYIWLCTLYNWLCTLYNWLRTLYNWLCTLYNWLCTLYNWLCPSV